jgi:hypothetical protein
MLQSSSSEHVEDNRGELAGSTALAEKDGVVVRDLEEVPEVLCVILIGRGIYWSEGYRLTLGALDNLLKLLATVGELADAHAGSIVVQQAGRGDLEDVGGEWGRTCREVVDILTFLCHGGRVGGFRKGVVVMSVADIVCSSTRSYRLEVKSGCV